MRKSPNYDVCLVAWQKDESTGSLSIADIIETSNHFASHFARRFVRDSSIFAISATRPHAPWNEHKPREIVR